MAQLAAELGYPSEVEAIRTGMRAIGGSGLILVAVTAADRPVGFIQANRFCIIETGFRVKIPDSACHPARGEAESGES